jgi:hypothetical protein
MGIYILCNFVANSFIVGDIAVIPMYFRSMAAIFVFRLDPGSLSIDASVNEFFDPDHFD